MHLCMYETVHCEWMRIYTFTRHNNTFTVEINSDVFFDDKLMPLKVFPNRGVEMKMAKSLPITENRQKQRSDLMSPSLYMHN